MATGLRVLLVHANPFQQVTPVPPYGLERIRAAVEPMGADVEILDPYLLSDHPIEFAVDVASRLQPDVIGLGIRIVDDCIVVDPSDAAAADRGRPFDVTWFMPEIRRLLLALEQAAPDALLVAGGAAFSAMPGECLDYLELEYGIVGAGEDAFRELLRRVAGRLPLEGVPGLVRRGEAEPLHAYALPGAYPTRREPLYAPVNSLPVRTRSGCAMQCAYCLTANLLRRHANGDIDAALAEIEGIAQDADARGIEHVSIFFADDELNLPEERHALALLRGLEERGLHERIRWRGYFNPTPFSDELAALIVSTNGHASITVDSAAEPVLVRTQKPFRRRHLDRTIETLRRHAVPADLGLIFGLPGENEETLAETVAFVRSLPREIEVVYSAGVRVYPHTPLAAIAAAEPHLVIGGEGGTFFEPAVYASPVPPRELARTLAEAFADLEHVSGVGVGFGSGRTTIATAYRAVGDGRAWARWREALALAEEPGDYGRSPAEALAALVQLAIWHGRFDLAAAAYKRLARQPVLPQGTTLNQIRVARLGCHVLAVLDRLGLRRRDVAEAAVLPSGNGS